MGTNIKTLIRMDGAEHKGDWVYLSYLAANYDPHMFADPHRNVPAVGNQRG